MDWRELADLWDGSSDAPAPGRVQPRCLGPFRLGEPRLSSAGTDWPGFLLEAQHASGSGSLVHRALTYSLVVLCTGGRARMRIETGGVESSFILERGRICVFPGGRDIDSCSWSGRYEVLVVEVGPCVLRHPLANETYLAHLPLAFQYGVPDPQVASLLCNMRAEIEAGCGTGRLYGESLSLALVTYLANRYPHPSAGGELRKVKLSSTQFARVREYVRAHLSRELGLAELAAVVHLSPHHFCLLFRNTAGITPYQYVLRERVHESTKRLAARQVPIVEIAGALGFANQSHFTAVFRKVTGMTPKHYQRGFDRRSSE